MQVIDLTKDGDNYKVITFPDGEVHLELAEINRKEPVIVKCRITNANELFVLMQLSDIIKRQCIEVAILEIYYLMGMRGDRLFDINRPFALRIVADVVNHLNAHKICIYEPHSNRTVRMIYNAEAVELTKAIAHKLLKVDDELQLVAPDKGAVMRYELPFVVVCSKVREESTGRLLDFKVEALISVKGRDLLMIDDLCDGGGTFVGLAPKIRELKPKSLSLLVTHAVQRTGIESVAAVYDRVYITNTYKNWSEELLPDNVSVFPLDSIN